jgi:hypothetical protein
MIQSNFTIQTGYFMEHSLISRDDAHAAGYKRYYTGNPCLRGHDSPRFVTTGGCVQCGRDRSNNYAKSKNSEQGRFVRDLHPDDFAAAHAYCDALDLQRGRVPNSRVAAFQNDQTVTNAIAQTRARLLNHGRGDGIDQHNASLPESKAEVLRIKLPDHLMPKGGV